ncbi:MAG: hypothetical protein R2698_09480 [Microthrixaceae bacterium]
MLRLRSSHRTLGDYAMAVEVPGGANRAEVLCCDNVTNHVRLDGGLNESPYPKDGIGDHVVGGAPTVNPAGRGTKAAARIGLVLAPGEATTLRVRMWAGSHSDRTDPFDDFDSVSATRRREADEFYGEVLDGCTDEEAEIARQAFAGMLWSKCFYHLDVEQWLDGDPAGPPPPEDRKRGRNAHWRHLNNRDVMSMPDAWEYPWYAAWDLACHCVTLAEIDPEFAKHQLTLLCREWFMHPNGQLPAYEWAFGDANPPLHAWAALRVFEADGGRDHDFLASIFHKLLINFTWWVNRRDAEGNNVFEGGFLGLDNIGPFDRSKAVPDGGILEQSDGTAWMAMYGLDLLQIALRLAERDRSYEDVATKFFEHFAYIATAMNRHGLWDERLGFYRDVFRHPDGTVIPIPIVSMVGLVPLFASAVVEPDQMTRHPDFGTRLRWFITHKTEYCEVLDADTGSGAMRGRLLAIVTEHRLGRVLARVLDESQMLSPHGLRSMSAAQRERPVAVRIGGSEYRVGYEPAESTTGTFGGNSNWRGPVWVPLNYLAVEALRRYHRVLGDRFTVEHPTGSGVHRTLDEVADDLADRLISLFEPGADGRRPSLPLPSAFVDEPSLRGHLQFFEYFDGDTGRGLGASHQTGWTGLVANLVLERARARRIGST